MQNLKYTEILQKNKVLSVSSFEKSLSAKILSNVTINSFKEILEYSFRLKKINPNIEIGNFDNLVQDSHNIKSENIVFIFYEILNIIDNVSDYFEILKPEVISELEAKIRNEIDLILANLSHTPTVIFNSFTASAICSSFTVTSKLEKFVDNLNSYLYSLQSSNLIIINIDKIIIELGREQSYDFRFYQSSKAPYSLQFFKTYIHAIESTINKITGSVKKVIIFDCDNTLWKGILGEDGIDNIQMSSSSSYGKPYHDVQCIARYLSTNGVLVGLCSKNNHNDVEEVLVNHSDMVLTNADIIIKEINWNNKVNNLIAISKQLNIGTDSIVFVDDSDYEINLIKETLPEIETFQVPKNSYQYKNHLLSFIYRNFNFIITEEDLKKTEQYKSQITRENEKKNFNSLENYISELKIKILFFTNNENQIQRISQLTQKTNQFNLTTQRYTESEIQNFINDANYLTFTGAVSDKFGDSGITILCIIILDKTNKIAKIDTFLMSCRIIGRNIEIVFLSAILQMLKDSQINLIEAVYKPTSKNSQVEDFYEKLDFKLTESNDGIKKYILDLNNYTNSPINYVELNYNE